MKTEKIAIKNGSAAENITLFIILVVACGLRLCTSNQMVAGSDPALETQGPLYWNKACSVVSDCVIEILQIKELQCMLQTVQQWK